MNKKAQRIKRKNPYRLFNFYEDEFLKISHYIDTAEKENIYLVETDHGYRLFLEERRVFVEGYDPHFIQRRESMFLMTIRSREKEFQFKKMFLTSDPFLLKTAINRELRSTNIYDPYFYGLDLTSKEASEKYNYIIRRSR